MFAFFTDLKAAFDNADRKLLNKMMGKIENNLKHRVEDV